MKCLLSPPLLGGMYQCRFVCSSAESGAKTAVAYRALIIFLASTIASCAFDIARLPVEKLDRSTPGVPAEQPVSKLLSPAAQKRPLVKTGHASEVSEPSSMISPEPPLSPALLDINAISAPMDALIYSLAAESDHQLKIVGQLTGRATIKLVQATLPQILEQLSSQSDFSWEIKASNLHIWSGVGYRASYSVDYLNIHRTTHSSVGLATQVGTVNADESSGYSIANSSQTNIQNTSEHSFWASLETDLELLVSPMPASALTKTFRKYSINREAGLLNVNAKPAVHRAVQQYLSKLHDSIHRQVLIEATVVEVALSDRFEAGIDWQLLANGLTGLNAAQVLVGAPVVSAETVNRFASPAGLVSLVQQSGIGDITATLSLLESFGNVKILSRPRIIALNNQSSVLKVVDNRVYFTTKVERSQSESVNDIITETEIHTVPVGLVMNVTPQISADGAVMLNVRPTLSRILGFVNDPNPELALANVQNGVPEIQVREMETMLRVQSGQVAVIGGLMQETSEKDNVRLPGLGRIPFFKHLFSHQVATSRQTELLIVLRPTLVPLNGPAKP
ncbi:MAG: MSHA type pilus biogenesis protein MshL [Granulosicoccus sp.]